MTTNDRSREQWIEQLYLQVFPVFARFVARNNGNEETAREVFQEAIITYYEKHGAIAVDNHGGYLFGICKNLYRRATHRQAIHDPLEEVDAVEERHEELSTERILHFLRAAGEKCLDLLQSFYYERLSMTDLATRFGYRSERSATVQKYKCLEKMRKEVKEKSLTYADFTD